MVASQLFCLTNSFHCQFNRFQASPRGYAGQERGWVFAESLSPGIGKIQASIIATFAAGYANDAHRKLMRRLKSWMR